MGKRLYFRAISTGVITMIVIILCASLLLSLLLSFTSLTEQSVQAAVIIIAFTAMLIGGFVAGRKTKEKGLLVGAITALVFSLLAFSLQYLGFGESFTMKQSLFHSGYLCMAAFGGMIGVNIGHSHS